MKSILLALLIIGLSLDSFAQQEFQFTGLSYTFNPGVGLKNPVNESLEDADMDLSELRAFIMLPFQLKNEKTIIIAGLDYSFLGGPLDNLPSGRRVDANLHALKLTAGINQKIGVQWAIRMMAMPTLGSDFSGAIHSDAFTLQASGLLRRIGTNGFRYGIGAAYTNGFGEAKMVPLLELIYQTDKWDILMVAPIQAAFRYHLKDMFLGFRIDLQGNEYALNADNNRENIPQIEGVKFSRYNLGPTVAWTSASKLRMQLSGGVSVKRKLVATDGDGTEFDYTLSSGAFLKFGLFFGDFKRK